MGGQAKYFGISERGPAHKSANQPNEDAWLGIDGAFGSLVVVCDGVGSRRHARIGAQQACLATRDAVRYWSAKENAPLEYLTRLIQLLWRIRIVPLSPAECATTCLLALRGRGGRWIIGGIGDGAAATRVGTGPVESVLHSVGTGFANETAALGMTADAESWMLTAFNDDSQGRAVLLATDGIADDLVGDRVGDFMSWMISRFAGRAPRARSSVLRKNLREWPTPRHVDDKTLAILWTDPELAQNGTRGDDAGH